MSSATTTEHSSATITAQKILDDINKSRNAKVTDSPVNEITKSIRNLINYCNAKILKDFQIAVIYKPTNTFPTELKNWYFPDLNFSNLNEYVINTFDSLERSSYCTQIEASSRCIDAIQVLVDYFNMVVLSRIDYNLELHEKKVDELDSSKLIETSILVNGDDFYG